MPPKSNPEIQIARNGHRLTLEARPDDPSSEAPFALPPAIQTLRLTIPGLPQIPGAAHLRVNAGLLPLLRLAAAESSFRFEVASHLPISTLPAPTGNRQTTAHSLARFLATHERGIIRIGASVQPHDLISQIALALPRARIAILASQRPPLSSLRGPLAASVGAERVRLGVPDREGGNFVALSTFADCAAGPIEKYDLVLLLDARQCSHVWAQDALGMTDARFRLSGFLRADCTLAPSEQFKIMAAFGPSRLDIPRPDCSLARVERAVITHRSPRLPRATEGLGLWRNGYWANPARNRRLAKLARAFRSDRPSPSPLTSQMRSWSYEPAAAPPGVTMLAANIEQALALAEYLPNWTIVAGAGGAEAVNAGGLSRRQRESLAERPGLWQTGQRQIVTVAAAASFRIGCPHVVIWAGGGPHPAPIPPEWLVHPVGTDNRILLVDVRDRHHPQLAAWSQSRAAGCRRQEWFPVGTDPDQGRCALFLSDLVDDLPAPTEAES